MIGSLLKAWMNMGCVNVAWRQAAMQPSAASDAVPGPGWEGLGQQKVSRDLAGVNSCQRLQHGEHGLVGKSTLSAFCTASASPLQATSKLCFCTRLRRNQLCA